MALTVPRRPAPVLRTVAALAVLVCHDGATWLPEVLSALRRSTPRPRHVLAVDTGSTDGTTALLERAAAGDDPVLDGIVTMPRGTGFSAAVNEAVSVAVERWGDPGGWIWLLHDDCAPDPDCLAVLLAAAEASPAAGVLGPLAVDWDDPRLAVECGLSTDSSGHRQTGVGSSELDWGRFGVPALFERSTEVLAVPSAGMLVRRDVWDALGGLDPAIPALRDDLDLGWRVNRAGHVVLCVPAARLRHARALLTGRRRLDAGPASLRGSTWAADRALGMRTVLINGTTPAYLIGLPRLVVLCLLRALGLAVVRRFERCRAELRALGYLVSGQAGLRAARAQRRGHAGADPVHGLLTSRFTRLRNTAGAGLASLVRRRVLADAALGRLPETSRGAVWLPSAGEPDVPLAGPDALPVGLGGRPRRPAGLRRPATTVAVAVPSGVRPSPRHRPSPVPRDGAVPVEPPDVLVVRLSRLRLLAEVLLAPPLLMVLALLGIGLLVNANRLGMDLAGGRLLPVGDLVATWSEYLAGWHPVAGGTAVPAPAALAVLGVVGTVFAPVGGPPAAVATLLLADLPLAGLSAYVATRQVPARRWVRVLVASGYALLPPATAAVAQGRLDAVVVHVLLPGVVAGITALLVRVGGTRPTAWLSTASGTALGLAVIGAFAPLVHLVLLAYALLGFVLVPGRRAAALFVLVLVPVGVLLPWPSVVVQYPALVLHGVGAWVPEQAVSPLDLAALYPGGAGGWPMTGLVVPVAAVVALVSRPGRRVLPGIALALLGVITVLVVHRVAAVPLTNGPAQRGWTGTGLLVVGWGLLWTVLEGCRYPVSTRQDHRGVLVRVAAVMGLLGVLAMATGVLLAGRHGALRDGGGVRLATTLLRELSVTSRSVLVLAEGGGPARQSAGRPPRFADDDLAPVASARVRLRHLDEDLRSTEPDRARAAVALAAAGGTGFVVLPDAAAAARLRTAAADLVADAPATSDGRPVLRLLPLGGPVTLLSPQAATQATREDIPPAELDRAGLVAVDAALPSVAVRVSEGPSGRLLVVAAEYEPAWHATADGVPVPLAQAWGHLVAVPVPAGAAEVRVEPAGASRAPLLLAQAAIVLFALITAIPGARAHESPSMTSGSSPR